MISLRILKFLLPALLALGVLGYVYLEGRQDRQDEIDRQNETAQQDAEAAELDFTECGHRDWMWDFAASRCRRPE